MSASTETTLEAQPSSRATSAERANGNGRRRISRCVLDSLVQQLLAGRNFNLAPAGTDEDK
jgi:hypothetical protein